MKNAALLLAASAVLTIWPDNVAAAPKAKRATPLELFRQAEAAADNYEFASAAELLERYSDALPRRGKAPVSDEEVEALTERVERGRLMMDRVEKIVVIDSISVPKKDFSPTTVLTLRQARCAMLQFCLRVLRLWRASLSTLPRAVLQ